MPTNASTGLIDRYFKISERGSTVGTEIRGGLVTFFAMAYIVVLNPIIIGTVKDGTGNFLGGGEAPNLAMVAAVTSLIAGIMSIAMGAIANFPISIAAGLGLNAFLAYSVAALPNMTWADAMGLVVIEGAIILVLVLTGFRKAVLRAIPESLKVAISVGIGLFIALIALTNAGFTSLNVGAGTLQLGRGIGGALIGWPVLIFIVGVFVMAVLMARRFRGAILIGIIVATTLSIVVEHIANIGPRFANGEIANPGGWGLTVPKLPDSLVDTPDFGLLGQFNLLGSFERISVVSVVLIIFTLLLSDFFDTMGTMVAVGSEAGLNDEEGVPTNSQKILVVDSVAAIAGGAGSASSNTAYIESAAGVGEGARTGLAPIVTGVLFLLSTLFAPVVNVVPTEAAAPALVIVGFLMMTQVVDIDWTDLENALPAFLTMALMPFTYSISVGIGAGFVSYVLIKMSKGKFRDIHPLLYGVAAVFVVFFAIDPIKQILNV